MVKERLKGTTSMGINKKILIITIGALFFLILVFYTISNTIIKRHFCDLDEDLSRRNVRRAINAINNEISDLNVIVGDYAAWDDTYKFIQDANQDYIDSNMMDETFLNLKVNFMAFINNNTELVYGKYFDLERETEIPIFDSLKEYILENSLFLGHKKLKSSIKGIISLPVGPMLIASRPIITGEYKGPIKGDLIMGRMITEQKVQELRRLTDLQINIGAIDSNTTINKGEIVNKIADKKTIVGETIMNCIHNDPILIISVETPRLGYIHWEMSNKYFIVSDIIIGIVFISIILIFLEVFILQRLSRLARDVNKIEQTKDFSSRISISGKDELSQLTININSMLDSLEKAREDLRESERWFSTTLKSIGDAVIATDKDGRVIFQNKIAEGLTGWTSEEAFQKPLNEIFHIINEITRQQVENPVDKIIREGIIVGLANRTILISKDGREIPIADSGSPIKDDKGDIAGVVLVFSDVTDSRKAVKELEFRLELEHIILNISGHFVNIRANEINEGIDRALKLIGEFFGVDRSYLFLISDDFSTMSNINEWCSEDSLSVKNRLQDVPIDKFSWAINKFKNNESIELSSLDELPLEAEAERQEFEIEGIKSIINVPMIYQGRLKGFLGFDKVREEKIWSSDSISLLRVIGEIFINAIERMANESNIALLATAIEQLAETIIITDINGKIQYANPSFEKITGYSIEEAIGKTPRMLKSGQQDELFYKNLWDTIKAGNIWRGHFINKRKNGEFYEEEAVISSVRDSQGKLTHFVAVKRDVTQEIKMANQLRQSQKMEAIGTLAGGIAHDFNNLLTGVLCYTNIIKLKSKMDDRIFQAADVIEKAAHQGAQLTAQLLGFARRGKHQIIPVDIHTAIQDVIKILSRTIPKNIAITQKLQAVAPYIMGDPGQMEQIIINLAVNASDAMPNGGELIIETNIEELDEKYCKSHAGAEPGKYLLITVTDTGTGISKDLQDRIFEPFFTTKEPGKGTGMGLATVYGIVKNHNGSVRVYSEVGHGTTFKIYLPLYAGQDIPVKPMPSKTFITGTARILLVDDEQMVRDASAEVLRHLGYKVVTASDGEEAIEYYKNFYGEIDLVILDMIMPNKGGRDCFREMKKINPDIIAILSTGYGMDGAAQEIIDEGMKGFVQKPFQLAYLSEVISKALSGKM